jgi:hypothetical protein
MPEGGCFECLAIGDTWLHLRFCVECEMTRCCNDSKNQHAMKHALWCFEHEVGIHTEQV